MMGALVCNIFPHVGEEDSILYKEILSYVHKNRALANLIYALSLQPNIKSSLSKSEMNRQGEATLEALKKKIDIDGLLAPAQLIENKKKEIGAVDKNGKTVEFDEMDSLVDKILDFNRDNPNMVAKIGYQNGKYIILVEQKNAVNFRADELLKAGREQLQYYKDLFARHGLNVTSWSSNAKRVLNVANAYTFNRILQQLIKFNVLNKIPKSQFDLVLDLFQDHPRTKPIIQRLRGMFGNDTAEVLSNLVSQNYRLPDRLSQYQQYVTQGTSSMIASLRVAVYAILRDVDPVAVNKDMTDIYNKNMSTEHIETQKTLRDLYDKYHIDRETFNLTTEKISNIHDLLIDMIVKLRNSRKIQEARGQSVGESKGEKEIADALKNTEYLVGVTSFLDEVQADLKSALSVDFEQLDNKSKAKALLWAKNLIATYTAILNKLSIVGTLESDFEADKIDEISKIAKEQLAYIEELKKTVAENTRIITEAFLRRCWGDEDTKQLKGSDSNVRFEVSLSQALDMNTVGVNMVDRLLLSMTECHDVVIATFGECIKSIHERRDALMREAADKILSADNELRKAGYDPSFMFERDKKGKWHIISEIDWDAYNEAYEKEAQRLKSLGYKGNRYKNSLQAWVSNNNGKYTVSVNGKDIKADFVPGKKYRKPMKQMNSAQAAYYAEMMQFKKKYEDMLQTYGLPTELFRPVQMTTGVEEALINGSSKDIAKAVKDKLIDQFITREDDAMYGEREVLVDNAGNKVNKLPAFYLKDLDDQSRLNRDFTKAMMNFAGMSINFITMAENVAELEVTKDFLLDREEEVQEGGVSTWSSTNVDSNRYVSPVRRKVRETSTGRYIESLVDDKFYGKHAKDEGKAPVLGIEWAKLSSAITSFNSTTGLAMNVPGAMANALVGKLQMFIDGFSGEFFSLGDMTWASAKYTAMIPAAIQDITDNSQQSLLHLLMNRFDVTDDWFDDLRSHSFSSSMLSKILSNTSLLFLYGMGEHMLHAQTMLACLRHVKVLDAAGKKVPLIDALERQPNGNGVYKIGIKAGYTTQTGKAIDDNYLNQIKRRISYVNRSMHGAFGSDDKGNIHRYVLGRLAMNFRQWMPAHYARRFNTLHWDAELGDFREGYYITLWNFTKKLCEDIHRNQQGIMSVWNSLSDMEKANMKRVFAEFLVVAILSLLSRLGFDDKERRNHDWWYAMLEYQVRRMNLEAGASSPFALERFIKNNMTLLNSPMAALDNANKLLAIMDLEPLITMRTIERGKYKGEYVYLHNVEKSVPFYHQVNRWWNMDEGLFTIFNDN